MHGEGTRSLRWHSCPSPQPHHEKASGRPKVGSEVFLPLFKPGCPTTHWVALESHFTSCLSFLICKMRIVPVPTSDSYTESCVLIKYMCSAYSGVVAWSEGCDSVCSYPVRPAASSADLRDICFFPFSPLILLLEASSVGPGAEPSSTSCFVLTVFPTPQ